MSIAPLVFTGISEFSDDFQLIVDRAVAIAALPLSDMQNEQSDLLSKKTLLSNLNSVSANMATSINKLATIGETRSLSASSSNTNRVSVTLNGATTAGTYTITEISSVAAAAAETSAVGFASDDSTAFSADGTMELVVGSDTFTVDLTGDYDNTLIGVRDAINALDAGVSASIINTGTGADPYYLSITSLSTGESTLQLRETAGEAGTNVLTADNQGANAVFKLNGLTVTKSENSITDVVEGLSFTIKSLTDVDESVTLSLYSSRGEMATGLQSLVTAYNSAREQVNYHIGEEAGLLSGDFIVREILSRLQNVAGYSGEGSIQSLADLGIEFDTSGVMSFDSAAFYALSDSGFNAALDFMGSSTSGMGLLANEFEAISDPVVGLIRTQQDQYDAADSRLSDQIEALSERIDYMQQTLSLKLQQADVLLADLASQRLILDASIEGLYLTLYGKKDR